MRTGDRAPAFDGLLGVDGKAHGISDFEGGILVVIFSCNHCPTVVACEDRMIQIQSDYGEKGVSLVAINPNDKAKYPSDDYDHMITRAREKGFNFAYLRDESQEVARAYGAERTPEVFVFDADRVLRYHGRIDDSPNDPDAVTTNDLRNALDALLEGRAVPVAETNPVGCTIKWK